MFLFPQLVEQKSSKVNGTIKVYKLWGKYSLRVDNLTQSGGLVKDIWQKALKSLQPSAFSIRHCLILGLGGGTAAHLVNRFWPQAHITAIELDPVMVNLGKRYLDLGKVKHLTIIQGDAFKKIPHLKSSIYNLILVDLYRGQTIPAPAFQSAFFNQLKRLKSPPGMIVFNFLHTINIPQLENYFSQINILKTPANRLLLVK